jgi:alkylation response protein AidB-like acyl-CoA dehydrogenase
MTGGASFNEVYLSEARVPSDALIGGPGMGWSVALTTLMNERTSIGAVGGLAGSSGSDALARLLGEVARATGRDVVTGPIRDQLADISIRTMVLQQHAGRIIAKLAQGQIPTAEGSAAKLLLSGLLERLANFAIEVQGPRGMLLGGDALAGGTWGLAFLGYPGVKIAGGSDEIMRNIIGERVLDLPREPR